MLALVPGPFGGDKIYILIFNVKNYANIGTLLKVYT